MSRYTIAVTRTASRHVGPDATIGYDGPLQTFLLQAFPDAEDLELWLGTGDEEFETLRPLRTAAVARGFDFKPLGSGILRKLLDDYARDAREPAGDAILQDLSTGHPPADAYPKRT